MSQFYPGDNVIYKMTKQSSRPTLRAAVVNPSPRGDEYNYVVEKFWVVKEVCDDGMLVIQTRRGKQRRISQADPNLTRANWWHCWIYKDRFPHLPQESAAS